MESEMNGGNGPANEKQKINEEERIAACGLWKPVVSIHFFFALQTLSAHNEKCESTTLARNERPTGRK